MSKTLISFLFYCFSSTSNNKVRKHQNERVNSLWLLQIKNVVLASACSSIEAYHSLGNKQTEKHPRWSILYTVKCAYETKRPRSTLRRVYATPRGVIPAMFLIANSIVVVSIRPKTKRDNAF